MSRMYPKQAVDIVKQVLTRHRKSPSRGPFSRLSSRQIEALTFLMRFVDEVRQARDLVRVIERLFEEGLIVPADPHSAHPTSTNPSPPPTQGERPCKPWKRPGPR